MAAGPPGAPSQPSLGTSAKHACRCGDTGRTRHAPVVRFHHVFGFVSICVGLLHDLVRHVQLGSVAPGELEGHRYRFVTST